MLASKNLFSKGGRNRPNPRSRHYSRPRRPFLIVEVLIEKISESENLISLQTLLAILGPLVSILDLAGGGVFLAVQHCKHLGSVLSTAKLVYYFSVKSSNWILC